MLSLVRRFLGATILQSLIGFVTGVILARTLGPSGRGVLAAVAVPLTTLPFILALGLPTFTSRSVAGGADLRDVIGTCGSLAIGVGLVAVGPCLVIFAHYASHDHAAHRVLEIGLLLLPITLAQAIVSDAGLGLQRWNLVLAQRLIPPFTALAGYLVLLAIGRLTAASAAVVVVIGGLLSALPFVGIMRAAWPPRPRRRVAASAARLSGFAWLIQTSQLLNHRLDQLVMAPLVPSRELGLYAVAVTASGVANMISAAITTVMYPKLASGEELDLARTLRRGLAAVAASGVAAAAVAPIVIPAMFGPSFAGAVPMLWILLIGNLPLSGASILASAYTARGRIALASLSEVVALGVTVGGLLIILPAGGGLGAAAVSAVAYTINFAWLLAMIHQDHGGKWRDYLLLTRADLTEGRTRLRNAIAIRRQPAN